MTDPGRNTVSDMIVAHVEREIAEWEAKERAGTLPVRSGRRRSGPSTVFSVRLDPDEVDALANRAAARGLAPSVLARNLIRMGLQRASDTEALSEGLDRVEAAVADLRGALPGSLSR